MSIFLNTIINFSKQIKNQNNYLSGAWLDSQCWEGDSYFLVDLQPVEGSGYPRVQFSLVSHLINVTGKGSSD